MLDLGDGAVDGEDGGLVEALKQVAAGELEVLQQRR